MDLPEFPEIGSSTFTVSASPARQTLAFEPSLVPRVRTAHALLSKRFAELIPTIEREPSASVRAIEECARQFGAVRHLETVWLYPLLAKVLEGDAQGRGQLIELRLVGLMLARRAQRCFDELLQSARAEVLVSDAATRVSAALANYSSHGETAIYPLYELIGPQRQSAAQVA
jgi:hypothetical protein